MVINDFCHSVICIHGLIIYFIIVGRWLCRYFSAKPGFRFLLFDIQASHDQCRPDSLR